MLKILAFDNSFKRVRLVFLKYYLTFNRKYDPVKYIRKTYLETII